MNRRSLIKSLFTLAAAPKLVAELDIKPPAVAPVVPATGLFSELNFVTPTWLPKVIAKYGQDTEDFVKIMDEMGQYESSTITFCNYSKPKYIEDGE